MVKAALLFDEREVGAIITTIHNGKTVVRAYAGATIQHADVTETKILRPSYRRHSRIHTVGIYIMVTSICFLECRQACLPYFYQLLQRQNPIELHLY